MPQPTLTIYAAPVRITELSDRRIVEASGIAASRRSPGLFYIHNDSGDAARVFLVNREGETVVTLTLSGARHRDYEDIAIAPGAAPGTFDVCVADIGDNAAQRDEVAIYRFGEVDATAVSSAVDVETTAYRFRYEDGPHNAEGFVVHPTTGDGYVLTKREDGRSDVYVLVAPWDANELVIVSRIASLRFPPGVPPIATMVTGADLSADGRRLATRSYVGGWEWTLAPDAGAPAFASIFDTSPNGLRLALELQGEAIAYAPGGEALLTVSEHTPTPLHEIRRVGGD
ncbi:MAG: hypothetical protein IID33_08685 [Planctomycetes bacterium]|nr:hypothetical protein [Planctomycetota bacterium]